MWINKKEYQALHKRLSKLENKLGTLSSYAERDYVRIQDLEKTVGNQEQYKDIYNYWTIYSPWSNGDTKRPKQLSVIKQLEQIKKILHIEEKVISAERKLVVKKPVEKPAKKAKK